MPSYQFRAIASENCKAIADEIINSKSSKEIARSTSEISLAYKIKNLTWNKIFSARDFENFSDSEYFKWIEIYQDAKNDYSNLNPATIEQKLALIEVINKRLIDKSLPLSNNILGDIEKLNDYKLRKLQTLINSIDLTSKITRTQLAEFSSEFALIIKGPPNTLLDYFLKNKTERMNDRLMRMVQEDVLLMGLKGIIKRIPEKNNHTRLQNAKFLIDKFFKHKIGRFFILPYDLPWIESIKIPDELLEKILLDGLTQHNSELITFLKSQNKIDQYQRFRKVYKPMAFSLGFYLYSTKLNDIMAGRLNKEQEEEKKEFLQDFENLSESVKEASSIMLKSEKELQEEQFERIIKNYKNEYKTEPTADEIKDIRAKIFK